MIEPEKYYDADDLPGRPAKTKMWKEIKSRTGKKKVISFFVADSRSFIWGMAASVLIYFSGVGIYTTLKQSIQNSRPEVVRFDDAYQSAIREFERVVPQVVSNPEGQSKEMKYLSIRKEELSKIDAAIVSLKAESSGIDLSPLKQRKLRELYSMKLRVLQDMIENGEIEL